MRVRLTSAVALTSAAFALVLVAPVLAGSRGPGHLDPSFGHGGLLELKRTDGPANAVDIGRKGRIVVAGDHTIARLRPNGHPDRSFGHRGLVRPHTADPRSSVAVGSESAVVSAKGAVYLAGATCSYCVDSDFLVSRLTPDGKLDESFGQGGSARIGFAGPDNEARSIAIASGGHVVVGGTSCDRRDVCAFELARLSRNGMLDRAFGTDGRVVGSMCQWFPFSGMALDSRARIVVGRSCGRRRVSLSRFTPDGSPDPTFGHGGKMARDVPINRMSALAIDSRDRIDVAGLDNGSAGVMRFGRSGKLDSSFGRHGVSRANPLGNRYMDPSSIELDSRDRMVVGSRALPEPGGLAFSRFKPDGRVNHRFGHDGTQVVGRKLKFREGTPMAIDRRDRIVGTGRASHRPHLHFALARLLG